MSDFINSNDESKFHELIFTFDTHHFHQGHKEGFCLFDFYLFLVNGHLKAGYHTEI
jgi:hypothetical protein